jgi:CHAT domain-containing protein
MQIRAVAFFLSSLLLASVAYGDKPPQAHELCETQFAAHPEAEDSAKCLASAAGSSPLALRRLRGLATQNPKFPWLTFYVGVADWESLPEAAALFRVAAGRFEEEGNARGEFLARANLYDRLSHDNRVEESKFEEQRAITTASTSRNPDLVARSQVLEAKALVTSGEDLSRASRLLAESRQMIFLRGTDSPKLDWLVSSGEVNLQTGRLDEAQEDFANARALANHAKDPYKLDASLDGLLRVLIERVAERPGSFDRKGILTQVREILAAAEAGKDANIERRSLWYLGMLTEGDESRAYFNYCRKKAKSAVEGGFCRGGEARKLAEKDPEKARQILHEVLEEKSEGPWYRITLMGDQMRVSWQALSPQQAIADSWAALEAIEDLRRAQGTGSRAALFSTFSDDYYWFSGSLLARKDSTPGDIAEAFAVTERLRDRTLLEKLAGIRPEPPSREALTEQLAGINTAIENVERRVGDPKLPPGERENARQDLAALQEQKSTGLLQLQKPEPKATAPDLGIFDKVRQHLLPGEALLSFQVAPWKDWTGAFGGGSWLTVVTGDARRPPRVYALRGREELRGLVNRLTTPLEGDKTDPGESQNLHELYRELLEPALADLPADVRRLIVLPDDDLHRVPFAALLKTIQSRPLVDRYQVTVAPSATLWLRERQAPPPPPAVPALVLAAPVQPDDLPPLPLAAAEGQAVVDALGGGSVLRIHQAASEAFVKSVDLGPFGIVHFSAHSVNDEEDPDRSSIRLTRSGGEDGFLKAADILKLELKGKVIVLSTCESAGGKILRGEGVMSLARAFFAAHAYTVVASLWPVEDPDAKKLFERFYRHLGEGASIAAALRAAQRERIEEGAPLKAWAAFVVLGDGDLVPLPGGRPPSPLRAWVPRGIAALLAVLLVGGAALAVRARRRLGGTPAA